MSNCPKCKGLKVERSWCDQCPNKETSWTNTKKAELARAIAKVRKAEADIARLNEAVCEDIDNRDYWEGRATNLAEAVGEHLGVDVGEHSSMNCPVRNAFIALNEAPALDTAAETNIKRLSYVMQSNQLAMVIATTLLESGRAAEAATWLRNSLTCYEGKWPHPNEDMDQWVAQQMEGVEWPSNPSISEAAQ